MFDHLIYHHVRRCDLILDELLRLIGITISRNLKRNTHTSRTRQSISNITNTINRFGSTLNTNARLRIFNAFIRPMPELYFRQPVWCWINKSNEKAISHTLQRCARVLLRKKSSTLDAEPYAVTNLMPFGHSHHYGTCRVSISYSLTTAHHYIYHR